MHADELRMAVTKIVELLIKSDIRSVVDQYRSAKGDQRTTAAARLGHAGAVIMERIDAMSPIERRVIKCLHLDSLGTADYWQELLRGSDDAKRHQAEIVRLASRVMFASSHLPALVKLLGSVDSETSNSATETELAAGEGGLLIRLTDAGERASDPDRVARAIDGVDMLYSACASIARKPAMDLRLDGVVSKNSRDRDLQFTGERDSVSAVYAVIDSIPAALADIDPEQDIDLDVVVRSLPIFEDLNTLASLGTFSNKDLKDISDTMHQGALLTLESGVILLDHPTIAPTDATMAQERQRDGLADDAAERAVSAVNGSAVQPSPKVASPDDEEGSAADRDEHYNRYLREREAMLRPQVSANVNGHDAGHSGNGGVGTDDISSADQNRRDAVDELLKSLGQSRSS